MVTLLLILLFVVVMFELTRVFFRAIGTAFGWIFGTAGWLVIGALAVTLFGLAMFMLPVILTIGAVSLVISATSS